MKAAAVGAGAALLCIGPAGFAQEVPLSPPPATVPGEEIATVPVRQDEPRQPVPGATLLEPIEVTGSRIRRTDYETTQPILVLTKADLERTGLTSIGEILQNLPIAGSAPNTQLGFSGSGDINVDLRGLGSLRTLLLVNGHRWINGTTYFSTGAADFTSIPISIIERVEVLKDSASAVYGSDAIAGVINIITRKDFQGSEWRNHAGLYDAGDGLTQSHSVSLGKVTGVTSSFVDLSYTRQDGIYNGDRDFTRVTVPGAGATRGSDYTPAGRIEFVPTPDNESFLTAQDPDSCPGFAGLFGADVPTGAYCVLTTDGQQGAVPDRSEFRAFDPASDRYSPTPLLPLLTPSERTAVFGQLAHRLTESVHLSGDLLINQRRSRQYISENGISIGDLVPDKREGAVFIARDNIYNPFDQDIGLGNGGASQGVGTGRVFRRMSEQGRRRFSQEVDTFRSAAAVSGPLDLRVLGIERRLDWEIGGSFAHGRKRENEENMINYDHLELALGPAADCARDPQCVPLNVLGGQGADGRGTMTPEMLDYIERNGRNSSRVVARDAFANFRTDLFDLPAGPLALAFGAEWRDGHYAHTPDPLVEFGNATTIRQPTAGGYSAREMYAEFAVPTLKDAPFAEALEVSLAGRYSDYARFGDSRTGEAGLRWKPLPDLLLRGSYGSAFRTPSVTEAFLGASDRSMTGASDPCTAQNQSQNQNYEDNCTADGANPAYPDVIVFHPTLSSGNPDLDPETAHTLAAGMVLSPGFLPDFNAYLDWYRISVDGFIFSPGVQFILDACYRAEPGQRAYCEQVHRNPDNDKIEYIHTTPLNLARLDREGIDLSFDYRLPSDGFGNFKVQADAAYLTEIVLFTPTVSVLPGGEAVRGMAETSGAGRFLGLLFAFPRWKANAALDWSQGSWDASWSVRYIHSMRERCVDGRQPSLRDLGKCSDPDPVVVTEDDPTTPDVDERDPDDSENVIAATMYHDLQAGYQLKDWDGKLSFGVNNLLDRDPPRVYNIGGPHAYSYDPATYDIPGGRFVYLGLSKNF